MTRFKTGAVVLTLTMAAGCGTTASGPTGADTPTSTAGVAGIPPKPDEATKQAYLADLRAIDPAIVDEDNVDKAVNRGRDQCSSVHESPGDQAKLVELTSKRFTGPDHPGGFGPEASARILAAVRKHICPTY